MAADKEIMKQIETLRLDRPGRTHAVAREMLNSESLGAMLISTLRELAATFREEAELWSRSGAKGWKGSEAEKYLVAQHVDDVAGQLDNAGGGAALSVSEPVAGHCDNDAMHDPHRWSHPDGNVGTLYCEGIRPPIADDQLETELRESAKRIDGVRDLAGLDKLIADSVAERRGFVRDEAERLAADPIDRAEVAEINEQLAGISPVAAYLSGAVDTLPGLQAALVPGSIPRMSEADNPFEPVRTPPYCRDCDLDQHRCHGCGEPVEHGKYACAQCELIHADVNPSTATMPTTWESDTMTSDGMRVPGAPTGPAPLLGQPGDASAGYSHTYTPPGGRTLTFAELLTPVRADALPPHLSHSQIGDVGDCGVQYRLQRVERLPQVPQWANIGGHAFHAAVEAFERTVEKMDAGLMARDPHSDWSGYDCDLAWKHHFEAEIAKVSASSPVPISMWRAARKGSEGRAWWEVNGPTFLRRYLARRPTEPTSNLPASPHAFGAAGDLFQLAIELELTVDVPTPYGPVQFKAQLDRVTNAPQPGPDSPESNWITLVIRDYKTSYERPTDTTQLGDYAHALRLWGVPESVRILGTYFDARRGEWTEPVDLLAEHPFEAFQYRVTAAHGQKRALTVGPTPARPSSFCGGCSVRYACPVMNQLKAVAGVPA